MSGVVRWVPDSARSACKVCERAFTVRRRRHHCRCCGDIFCAKCVSIRLAVDADLSTESETRTKLLQRRVRAISGAGRDGRVRVCQACRDTLPNEKIPASQVILSPARERAAAGAISRAAAKPVSPRASVTQPESPVEAAPTPRPAPSGRQPLAPPPPASLLTLFVLGSMGVGIAYAIYGVVGFHFKHFPVASVAVSLILYVIFVVARHRMRS